MSSNPFNDFFMVPDIDRGSVQVSFTAPEGFLGNYSFTMDVVGGGPRGQILRLTVVPEPASCLLLVLGVLALLCRARRNRGRR